VGRERKQSEREVLYALLRQARKDAGLTQANLAARLGRPQSFVSKYERGDVKIDILELRLVCHSLGITLSTLVRRLERALGR
jgi:transcriptional regulator with XRE-family HTH domain